MGLVRGVQDPQDCLQSTGRAHPGTRTDRGRLAVSRRKRERRIVWVRSRTEGESGGPGSRALSLLSITVISVAD